MKALPSPSAGAYLPLLSLMCLLFVLWGAWGPESFNDNESCYARVIDEMLAGGNWNILTFNGIKWLEKPPLCYWLSAVSVVLLG